MKSIFKEGELVSLAKALYLEEREIKRLDGWFLAKETEMKNLIEEEILNELVYVD